MALEVIGAGFGRTGTDSMKDALEALGLGPCHHMKEVLASPDQLALWRAVARGDRPDWDRPDWDGPDLDTMFSGFRSAVDWPSAFYWREIAAHYPDAKILLTVRDADGWYASFSNTILKVVMSSSDPDSLGRALIVNKVFGGRPDDRSHAIAAYERNTVEVQAAFGPDRLLTYRLGDGWEPLCRFLGRPVPAEPFPHRNTAADFQAFMASHGARP